MTAMPPQRKLTETVSGIRPPGTVPPAAVVALRDRTQRELNMSAIRAGFLLPPAIAGVVTSVPAGNVNEALTGAAALVALSAVDVAAHVRAFRKADGNVRDISAAPETPHEQTAAPITAGAIQAYREAEEKRSAERIRIRNDYKQAGKQAAESAARCAGVTGLAVAGCAAPLLQGQPLDENVAMLTGLLAVTAMAQAGHYARNYMQSREKAEKAGLLRAGG